MRQMIENQNDFCGKEVLLYMLREYMVYAQVWVTQKRSRRGREVKDVQNPKF